MSAEVAKDLNPSREEFAAMLAESLAKDDVFEGTVVKGKVVGLEKDLAVIDVGLKMEGRVPVREFSPSAKDGGLTIGDEVEVYLERVENALGEAVLSRDKARREESWSLRSYVIKLIHIDCYEAANFVFSISRFSSAREICRRQARCH